MTIAVIGASGRTGAVVVKDALSAGHEVIGVAGKHQPPETAEHNLTRASSGRPRS